MWVQLYGHVCGRCTTAVLCGSNYMDMCVTAVQRSNCVGPTLWTFLCDRHTTAVLHNHTHTHTHTHMHTHILCVDGLCGSKYMDMCLTAIQWPSYTITRALTRTRTRIRTFCVWMDCVGPTIWTYVLPPFNGPSYVGPTIWTCVWTPYNGRLMWVQLYGHLCDRRTTAVLCGSDFMDIFV